MKKVLSTTSSRLIIILLILGIASCEREVHVDLGSTPPKVVVQGAIENGKPPYVILTSTMSFFSTIDLSTFQGSFLHDAQISVSDGSKVYPFREYSFDTGNNSKFYVYSIDTAIAGNLLIGQVGKIYNLSITYNGVTYTSVTKIPVPKGVDTMWFDTPEFVGSRTPLTAKEIFVNYSDPDTLGDYVRTYTSRDNQPFYASELFSDEVVNGKTIHKIGIQGGYPDNGNISNRDSLRYFFPGEKVTLQWSSIDKGVYTFWNTLQFAKNAQGNPFSSPINVTSNISNGALGVWAGYGTINYTLTVPN